MNYFHYWIGFTTLVAKEIRRFMGFWADTMLPPIITSALYFLVFGHLMGSRIGVMDGYSYIQYIAPGLIMMSVITGAYSNVAFSFFTAKFFRSLEDILISPIPNGLVLLGFLSGGITRGMLIAALVIITAMVFTHLPMLHPILMIFVLLLTCTTFSLFGFINGLFARKFDDIGIVPTFILMPLSYLGGVFFSIEMLPNGWKIVSKLDPILYFINLFRYSMLGVSDVSILVSFFFLLGLTVILFIFALELLRRGVRIKT